MALYKLKTQLNYGEFKGRKIKDIINDPNAIKYLLALHFSKRYNVKLDEEILKIIKTGKKISHNPNGQRTD